MPLPRIPHALMLVAAVAVMAACVWLVGHTQREAALRSFDQAEQAQAMLTAMVDQETGLRGYLLNGRQMFLEPYFAGGRSFKRALGGARSAGGGGRVGALLTESEQLAGAWRRRADAALEDPSARRLESAVERKALMDEFRAVNQRLRQEVEQRRSAELSRASWLSGAAVVGLSTLFGLAGWLLIGRPLRAQRRREQRRHELRGTQAVFARGLQMSETESYARSLVERHLERSVSGAKVKVLDPGDPSREPALCAPLLASGEVIGSVQIVHPKELTAEEREIVADTVNAAAPALANLRNLALAEQRAATDALTGLANRRALNDALERMVAQATRSRSSLTAITLDLDNFKRINDRHGHDVGDAVLRAAAVALTRTLRASDFVARAGGEEFVVLLPDTGLDGALVVAENLRAALLAMTVPGLDAAVSGSFGVAVHPEDAADADSLLRAADRALYAAKRSGRNRVEAAAAAGV